MPIVLVVVEDVGASVLVVVEDVGASVLVVLEEVVDEVGVGVSCTSKAPISTVPLKTRTNGVPR